MRVTCVGTKPTKALLETNAPVLTPELLAACGARYSRNGEGLSAILERVENLDEDSAVDSIFKMVDYGHQSIADMVPISMFIDGVSLWLALRIWSSCPTAGGQESSTRYIRLGETSTISDFAPLSATERNLWNNTVADCFRAYETALELWTAAANQCPQLLRLPASLLESSSPKDKRKADRMTRNFAFDRARYYLPTCGLTNVMLLMSARGWVALIKQLASEQLEEPRRLAALLKNELIKVAPRLVKYAVYDDSYALGFKDEFDLARTGEGTPRLGKPAESGAFLETFVPSNVTNADIARAVQFHRGRYDFVGTALQRTGVRFGWESLPIAELRDLNRHRTGTKYFTLRPVGAYFAEDEIERAEKVDKRLSPLCEQLRGLRSVGERGVQIAAERLGDSMPDFVYWLPMGTQCYYEHTTTANHFLYQCELRTGLGAHYVYADRMNEVLSMWHDRYPETAQYVKAGSAEPE